jgi:putative ABC transport system substrate-binding protein
MKRREFILAFGGAAAASSTLWPLATRAQPALPVVGFLNARSPEASEYLVAAFRRGLAESGYVEGQNVTVEYRWALGQPDRLPAMATELAGRPVAVLAATGGEDSAMAAKAATRTVPIVFAVGSDPIELGLVASYNRPGGNVTGVNIITTTLEAKRLGLLHEMVPQAGMIGILLNPKWPPSAGQLRDLQEAARVIGLQVHVMRASTDNEIDAAFDTLAQQRIAALAVTANPFYDTRREKLVAMAARLAVPAIYQFREFAVAGGLMSYGIDLPDAYRQVGVYAGRILNGAKPEDLPVLQPTKFDLVLNLKTAKTLGLTIPPPLLALADEVIE